MLLTCCAVVPEEETGYAQDEDRTRHGEGEYEAYCSQEGDIALLRLELGVLVQLQGTHGGGAGARAADEGSAMACEGVRMCRLQGG